LRRYRPTPCCSAPRAALAAAALVASLPAWAGTGVPDDQLWSELDVIAPLGDKTSVTGIAQLRLSEELPNPTYSAGGLDLNYKAGNWTLSAGYRHQVTGDRGEEDYPNITQIALLMATYAWRLGRSTVLFRTRLENTITASSNPWRVRFRGEYRWATPGLGAISYLFTSDEVFYQASDNEWFRNRFQAGMNLIATPRTGIRLYYQRQDSKNTTPGAINALGITAAITF
jgi:Protein of unknown function (DUF2490)